MPLAESSAFFTIDENQRGLGVMPDEDVDLRGLLRGSWVPREPIPFRPNVGSVPSDLIMGGAIETWLISAKFRSVLEAGGFTGWSTYPVAPRGRRGVSLDGYSGLSITGRAGLPRWEQSQPFVTQYVPNGPPVPCVRGIYFDADTWDGSDMFLLGDYGYRIVTANVRNALVAAKIRNVRFGRLSEREIAVSAMRREVQSLFTE